MPILQIRRVAVWALLFLSFPLLASPQTGHETPAVLLTPTEKHVVPAEIGGSFIAPALCDGEGNIYIRAGFAESTPVTKISSDGEVVARFSLDSVPDPEVKKGLFQSFAVDLRGHLYALIHDDIKASYIVKFDEEGKYEDTVKLKKSGFWPYTIVAFPSGEYLISGMAWEQASSGVATSYTAIFDSRGELIQELSLPQDVKQKEIAGNSLDAAKARIYANLDFQGTVGHGAAAIGPDGNAYLVRAGRPPIVYVLSAGGILVRRMVLESPEEGLDPLLPCMAGGRLVVPFTEPVKGERDAFQIRFYALYDTFSGDHLVDYTLSPELSAGFVCYSPGAFLFLGMGEDGRPVLIKAKSL